MKTTNLKSGESDIFESQENPLSIEEKDSIVPRVMDCMDCHNRPSHRYSSPPSFIDNAITGGIIPNELPGIKSACINATKPVYNTKDTAVMLIRQSMLDYYKLENPEVLKEKPELLEQAIISLQKVYTQNIFPFMKVRWEAYPDHIGHKETNGCFRCHDDKHISEKGKVITKNCNLCHEIKAQGIPGAMQTGSIFDTLDFVHPVDIGDAWKENLCSECHMNLY